MITGGEPLLCFDWMVQVLEEARRVNPKAKIYLYSADYQPLTLGSFMPLIDGLHYTLHEGINQNDLFRFQSLQRTLNFECYRQSGKSFRLYINPKIDINISINPSVWTRVESKPWIPESECKLPPGEKLYTYLQPTKPNVIPSN